MTPADQPVAVVVGAGLVGASVGCALTAAGYRVHLTDRVASHATVAAGMVASLASTGRANPLRSAPIYRFADAAEAARAVARLRGLSTPATLVDRATLRAGIAADLPPDAEAALWRRAMALVDLLTEAGVTVALALEAPAGVDRVGVPWLGDDGPGDWVI